MALCPAGGGRCESMTVHIGVLGPVLVHDGRAERPVAAAKQRVILAALLLRAPRVVPADELADLVWESGQPRNARAAINTYMGRLRRSLGPDLAARIRTIAPGYSIDLSDEELDLAQFARLRAS